MRSWNEFSSNLGPGLFAVHLWVACFAAVLQAAAEPAFIGSSATSAAELLAGFREMPGLEARFEEEKTLALLAAPLRSTGRLYFSPPSTLLRRIETPHPQEILIRANQVRIRDGKHVQSIDLAARQDIRPLVDSLIWIFRGDLVSIEKFYRVEFRVLKAEIEANIEAGVNPDTAGRWQMRLVPTRAPLSNLLRELLVRGEGRAVDTLELIETSGDRTITRILDANPRRQFDRAERLELFGIGDP